MTQTLRTDSGRKAVVPTTWTQERGRPGVATRRAGHWLLSVVEAVTPRHDKAHWYASAEDTRDEAFDDLAVEIPGEFKTRQAAQRAADRAFEKGELG